MPKATRMEDPAPKPEAKTSEEEVRESRLVIQRVTSLANRVVEATSESIVPLLEAADIGLEVFVASTIKEFADSLTKADSETRKFIMASPEAYMSSVAHQAASIGLCLGSGVTGRHASIVFRKRRSQIGGSWQTSGVDAVVQPEWRGVLHLIKRANRSIRDIKVELIGPDDVVEIDRINDTVVRHTSPNGAECEPSIKLRPDGFELNGIAGGYAIVTFLDGARRIVRVTRADIIRSALCSETLKKPYDPKRDRRPTSPWVLYTKAMCYKTVVLALYRKPDVWSPVGGDVFAPAGKNLEMAYKQVNKLDGNRIIPPSMRDERVDRLLETIAPFGGTDETLVAAAKQLGYEDPALVVNAGKWEQLVDVVGNALHA